jgi:hypothetical protein
MTVWIYEEGEDLKVFASEEIAQARLDENDPEGDVFEYEVIGAPAAPPLLLRRSPRKASAALYRLFPSIALNPGAAPAIRGRIVASRRRPRFFELARPLVIQPARENSGGFL